MLDAIDHLTDILIGLAILFLVPLIFLGLKKDDLIRSVVSEKTALIVDETRSHGYLSREMFEEFQESLSKTGLLYDITLEHREKILEPEYRFRTIEEILEEQNKAFTGSNVYHYYPVSTNIPVVTDPIDNSGLTMNTETNASILAKSSNTPSNGHVHTDACFAHKHINPYGTTDMSNSPIIVQKYNSQQFYNDAGTAIMGYSYHGANVMCGLCYRRLYSFYYDLSYGKTSYLYYRNYFYDSAGTQSSTTTTVPIPWTGSNFLLNEINNKIYNFTQYEQAGIIAFPWEGYPKWDAAGNLSYIPYLGCSNVNAERHQNPAACYPVGKITNVNFSAGFSTNDYYGWLGDRMGNITLTCADCNGVLLQISTYASAAFPQINGYRVRSDISTNFNGYNHLGQIKNISAGAGMDLIPVDASQIQAFNDITTKVDSIWNVISNTKYNTPSLNVSPNGRNWNTTRSVPFLLPGMPLSEFSNGKWDIVWRPYRGCPYCGTFGSAYTCGQLESTRCDKVIASIVPTHPVQAVFTGEAIISTVTVIYLDGSTKVAVANTDFNTNTPITNKTVTLNMTDSYGNTKTCTIIVTVVPRTKTCIHGHTYNLSNDGSDPGCPFCKAWLASLRIEFPTTPTFTIFRGTTLAENGVTLLATYLDGHTELLESEYIDNLDRYYVGSQSVTMSYKGHYVYLMVVTKRNLKLCPVCHRHYELHPDDSDPGCPWCAARTPIFTGNVMRYDRKKYTKDILEALYEGDGIYRFTNEDFLKISIKSKRGSTGTRLISAIYINNNLDTIHVIKGGYVREDGYYYK